MRFAPVVFLLLWSGGFTVAKLGINDADPITLLSLRYFCVLVLLLPFVLYKKPKLPNSASAWWHVCIVGFLIQVVYFGTCWTAFRLGGSASTVALVTSLQPLLVALVIPWVASERVSKLRWVGLLLGLLGTALVIVGNSGVQIVGVNVIVFSVLGLLGITTATVWEKRFGTELHPLTSNTIHYIVGFSCTLPLAFFFEEMNINVTAPFIFALLYLVVGNSILAISLLLFLIRQGEATRVSSLFFLVPPMSALIAWQVLGEAMMPAAWLGMVIAAFGVWLVTRSN
ncbi:MAG: DMT family transporter [Gammaproteobacteria bacterium]|nr:DMT family transporter [Gammaproteobacteria bacterium]